MAGRLPMNERFALHMDRCLTCRACEAVCPSQVRFGQLIDGARTMMDSERNLPRGEPVMRKAGLQSWIKREFVAKPARLDALRPLLRFYQNSSLKKWIRKSGLLGGTKFAVLEAQLPFIEAPVASSGTINARTWEPVYPTLAQPRGQVGLFLGCVARLTDSTTLNATIFVLNRLGYTVHVPSAQTCCGALHQHSGDRTTAEQLALQNIAAFNGLRLEAILSTASGCGVQLGEYGLPSFSQPSSLRSQLEDDAAQDGRSGRPVLKFSAKVMDIGAFLDAAEGWNGVKLAPLPHKIAVHEPCSLRNVLRGSAHAYALLARIPGAQITPLAGNDQCCGAAGTYFIDQPDMAAPLLHDKMTALKASGARYLATSNVGCAMHISSGLREAGSEIEVVHPVTLIARQMGIQ
jgi:glycolate oxidase iron-sulfur subunit